MLFVFFWVVGFILRDPILPPSFRLNNMELLFATPLKCPCRFGGTGLSRFLPCALCVPCGLSPNGQASRPM